MSAKKRRRRRRPSRPAAAEAAGTPAVPEEEPMPEPSEAEPPPRPGLFGGRGRPSPYPPLGQSLARGLLPVGGSPAILIVTFLSELAMWGLVAGLGLPPEPVEMVLFLAVPPVSTSVDGALLQGLIDPLQAIGVVAAVVVLRAVFTVLLAMLVLDAVRGERPDVREAARALPRLVPTMAAILAAELAGIIAGAGILQGFLGPQAGLLLIPLALFFLGMAPIVAVTERTRAADVLRRTVRAARLPGSRHFGLIMLYFGFVFFVTSTSPVGTVAPATPSILTWAYALTAAFLHVGFLGALAYRWLAVRDQVPTKPARPAKRKS